MPVWYTDVRWLNGVALKRIREAATGQRDSLQLRGPQVLLVSSAVRQRDATYGLWVDVREAGQPSAMLPAYGARVYAVAVWQEDVQENGTGEGMRESIWKSVDGAGGGWLCTRATEPAAQTLGPGGEFECDRIAIITGKART